MKAVRFLALVCVVLVPSFALADASQSLLPQVPSIELEQLCDGGCAPRPIAAFPVERARLSFELAQPVTEAQLLGSWKVVGFTLTNEALAVFKDRADAKHIGYDVNGLKNNDGSDFFAATFGHAPTAFGPVLSVTLENLGNAQSSQGPYEATIKRSGACFATYAYNASLQGLAYFEFECRSSGAGLICQTTYHKGESSASTTDVLDGRVVHYFAYVRR